MGDCQLSLASLQGRLIEYQVCKGVNITSAGWQVTLCDPIWHVSSSTGEARYTTCKNCYTPFAYLLTYKLTHILTFRIKCRHMA